MSRWITQSLGLAVFAVSTALTANHASAADERMKIWDLKLGATVAEMPPLLAFKSYACGSNGGPPRRQLEGWADFMECEPEPSGLYEVYFEYDDEAEYIARAYEDARLGRDIGTVDKSFPVITSALFDSSGVLNGIRLVTDPRWDHQRDNEWANLRPREEHYLLGAYLAGQFKISADDCVDIPLAEGESTIGGVAVKKDCERVDPETGYRYVLQQRFFRKKGQAGRDPHTGALTRGQYESSARAEIYLATAPRAEE